MLVAAFLLLSSHNLNVETDVFAVSAEVVFFKNLNLVECSTEVLNTEALVLVVLDTVLVVEVNAPELAHS